MTHLAAAAGAVPPWKSRGMVKKKKKRKKNRRSTPKRERDWPFWKTRAKNAAKMAIFESVGFSDGDLKSALWHRKPTFDWPQYKREKRGLCKWVSLPLIQLDRGSLGVVVALNSKKASWLAAIIRFFLCAANTFCGAGDGENPGLGVRRLGVARALVIPRLCGWVGLSLSVF